MALDADGTIARCRLLRLLGNMARFCYCCGDQRHTGAWPASFGEFEGVRQETLGDLA